MWVSVVNRCVKRGSIDVFAYGLLYDATGYLQRFGMRPSCHGNGANAKPVEKITTHYQEWGDMAR